MSIQKKLISFSLGNRLCEIKNEKGIKIELCEKIENVIFCQAFCVYDNNHDRNFTINSKCEFSYLPKGKDCIVSDDGTKWKKQNRQISKIGKGLKKLFTICKRDLLDSEVEYLVNRLKSKIEKSSFQFLSGDDLVDVYSNAENHIDRANGLGSLGSSCMNNKPSNFFEIYKHHAKLLVLRNFENNLIIGRAITWNINEKMYMDRIYGSDVTVEKFKNYALKNSIIRKASQHYDDVATWVDGEGETITEYLNIPMKKQYENYPYMDTFKYSEDLSTITNDIDCNIYLLEDTCGGYSNEEMIYDDINDELIHEDDAVPLNDGTVTHRNNVVCDFNGDYILHENACHIDAGQYEGELYEEYDDNIVTLESGDTCYVDDATYCYDGEYYLSDEVHSIDAGQYEGEYCYHDDINIVYIDEIGYVHSDDTIEDYKGNIIVQDDATYLAEVDGYVHDDKVDEVLENLKEELC